MRRSYLYHRLQCLRGNHRVWAPTLKVSEDLLRAKVTCACGKGELPMAMRVSQIGDDNDA